MTPRQPNAEQLAAIAFRTGPLRIIAGAGTGKSSTLVASALDLVTTGAAAPHEILALTFTDAAAAELAARMREGMVAAGLEGDITVDTYNAFGGSIVAEHGRLLDLPPEPRLLTPGEAFVIVWRSIDEITFTAMDLTTLRPHGYGGSGGIGDVLTLHSR
ncbi:MAG TPA: UvrD-helicase domain-containing protein, partial [Thermomicrobiales bacterium]|nr:UvrD-helicase domain-containing protein [Thermomicrobiales bacterium]